MSTPKSYQNLDGNQGFKHFKVNGAGTADDPYVPVMQISAEPDSTSITGWADPVSDANIASEKLIKDTIDGNDITALSFDSSTGVITATKTAGDLTVSLGLGTLAYLSAIDADTVTLSNIEIDNFKASAIVTEAEGIGSNDNDSSVPTSAAVKDYVDNNAAGDNTFVNAASFNTTDGILTLTRNDSGTVTVDLDGRYSTVDTYVTGASFNTSTGVLTLTRSEGLVDVIVDLDGKYQDALTFGIADTNAVKIDSSTIADDEYARFTANGLESRSTSELKTDLGLGTLAELSSVDADLVSVLNLEIDNLKSGVLDTDLNSVAATDTTLASAKAIKSYVDSVAGTGFLNTFTQNDNQHIATEKIQARDGDGLKLFEDGGTGIFVQDGGQVGIGTTSPDKKLHVSGDSRFDSDYLHLRNSVNPILRVHTSYQGDNHSSTAQYGKLQFYSNDYQYNDGDETGSIAIGVNDQWGFTPSLRFNVHTGTRGDSSTERMRLTKHGLGIGTTSIGAKLHVSGDLIADAVASGMKFIPSSFNESSYADIDFIANTPIDADDFVTKINSETNITTTITTGELTHLQLTAGNSKEKSIIITSGNNIRNIQAWNTQTNTNNSDNISIQAMGGNLGVGTTSPTEKLEVSGNIKLSGNIVGTINCDTTTVSNVEVDNFKSSAIVTEAEGIGSNDNDSTLPTSAAVKDYVDNTVIPDTNTFVNLASFNTASGVLTLTRNDSGTVTVDLDGKYLNLSDYKDPAETFTQASDQSINTNKIQAVNSSGLSLLNDGGDGLYVTDNDKVGIKTSSPAHELEINGALGITNSLYYTGTNAATANPMIHFAGNASGNGIYIGSSETVISGGNFSNNWTQSPQTDRIVLGSDDGISMYVNAETYANKVELMTLKSNSRVGINNNNPTHTLDVAGDIKFSGEIYGNIDGAITTFSNIVVSSIASSALCTESEGIASNDNDTTLPTSAAVKDYVDANTNTKYVNAASFNTSTSVLTLTRADSATITVDLEADDAANITHGVFSLGGLDTNHTFGRVTLAGISDIARISHEDWNTNTSYALQQTLTSITKINSTNLGYVGFHINNQEKFRLTSDGKLAVGATSADELLHVTGNIKATGNFIGTGTISIQPDTDSTHTFGRGVISNANGGTTDTVTFSHYDMNSINNYGFAQTAVGETYINAASNHDIKFQINNANKVIIDPNGKVGINTTSPDEMLHVEGNIKVNGTIIQGDGQHVSTDKIIARDSGGLSLFEDSGTGIFVKDGGQIGINTVHPTAKLHVHGDLIADSPASGLRLIPSAFAQSSNANLDFIANSPIDADDFVTKINTYTNITTSTSDVAHLQLTAGNSKEKSIIITSGNNIRNIQGWNTQTNTNYGGNLSLQAMGGYLGVATATPSEYLHVNGNARFDSSYIYLRNTVNPTLRIHTSYQGDNHNSAASYGKLQFYSNDYQFNDGDETGSICIGVNDQWGFVPSLRFNVHTGVRGDSSTEQMRLTKDGLGIGLYNPTEKLDISGNAKISGSISKGSGSFDIPHPDPVKEENGHRLRHYFVETNSAGGNIYKWQIELEEGENELELPNYFEHLNESALVWVNPAKHFGIGFGEVEKNGKKAILNVNSKGVYNVLIFGDRKDAIATKEFEKYGIEYKQEGDTTHVIKWN